MQLAGSPAQCLAHVITDTFEVVHQLEDTAACRYFWLFGPTSNTPNLMKPCSPMQPFLHECLSLHTIGHRIILFQIRPLWEERIPITCPILLSFLTVFCLLEIAPTVKTPLRRGLENLPRLILNLIRSGKGPMIGLERNPLCRIGVILSNCRSIASAMEGATLQSTGSW